MIRLNKMTDYAVVMLGHMANDNVIDDHNDSGNGTGKMVTAAQMAHGSGVPLPTASKLLKQLNKAGILSSQRGAGGGYSLERRSDDITVAEIVVALEGPIALTACIDGADTTCESIPLCAMSGRWNKVNRAIQVALEEVSLADMMPPPPAFKSVLNAGAKSASIESSSKLSSGEQNADTTKEKAIESVPK